MALIVGWLLVTLDKPSHSLVNTAPCTAPEAQWATNGEGFSGPGSLGLLAMVGTGDFRLAL